MAKTNEEITMNNVIFRDQNAGVDFFGTSTKKSETIEKIDGVDYFVIPVEISSASHPHYTGKENIIDSAGRVDKFKMRESKKSEAGKSKKTKERKNDK